MPAQRPFCDNYWDPELPRGGRTFIRRGGQSAWVADNDFVKLAIDFSRTVYGTEIAGVLDAGTDKWPVEVVVTPFKLEITISRPDRRKVVSGHVTGESEGDCHLLLNHSNIEFRPWHARMALCIEGSPAAIWWKPWRDQDLALGIDSFLWIDQMRFASDWAVFPAIVDLMRQQAANNLAFLL